MRTREKIIRWLGLPLIGLALLATVGWLVLGSARAGPVWLQGQIETKQIRVAAKVGGRIASIKVDEGDLVKEGQILIVLDTPEVQARARQVDAQVDADRAMSDKAETGAHENYEITRDATPTGGPPGSTSTACPERKRSRRGSNYAGRRPTVLTGGWRNQRQGS